MEKFAAMTRWARFFHLSHSFSGTGIVKGGRGRVCGIVIWSRIDIFFFKKGKNLRLDCGFGCLVFSPGLEKVHGRVFCRTVLECCTQVRYSAIEALRKGSGREAVRFWVNKIARI